MKLNMLLKVLAARQILLENFVGTVTAFWFGNKNVSVISSVPWVRTRHIASTSRAVSPHSLPVTEVQFAGHVPPDLGVRTQPGVSGGDQP